MTSVNSTEAVAIPPCETSGEEAGRATAAFIRRNISSCLGQYPILPPTAFRPILASAFGLAALAGLRSGTGAGRAGIDRRRVNARILPLVIGIVGSFGVVNRARGRRPVQGALRGRPLQHAGAKRHNGSDPQQCRLEEGKKGVLDHANAPEFTLLLL